MSTQAIAKIGRVLQVRWKPNSDLVAVLASWILVVGALSIATRVIGPEAGGGLPYFFLYAVLAAAVFGVGIPLYWMIVVRRRSLEDLGLTVRRWPLSLLLQAVLAVGLFAVTPARAGLPPFSVLGPLVALALTIGLFEAIFWRGWVLLRLEEALGTIPAMILGSALYAAYHVGYAMPLDEIVFLFFIGILFAAVFLFSRSVLILWPFFQPMGQLITLIRDGLTLPPLAAVGFLEVLVGVGVLIWLAARYQRRRQNAQGGG